MRIADALNLGKGVSERYSDTPGLDSQVLIAHLTGRSRSWVLAHPNDPFPINLEAKLSKALKQIKGGMPLPYVLGVWEFYNQSFELTPDVLIPRPETEILVEKALAWLAARPGSRRAADIGTGSGCIAVSLAIQVSDLQVIATDISEAALAVARTNAAKHQVADRVEVVRANLLEPVGTPPKGLLPSCFDLITANLPYIPTEVLHGLTVFQQEPHLALDGGKDGMGLIRGLIKSIPPVLKPDGLILLEIEANQGKNAIELAQAHFPDANVSLHSDLSGHDRLLSIQT